MMDELAVVVIDKQRLLTDGKRAAFPLSNEYERITNELSRCEKTTLSPAINALPLTPHGHKIRQ